MDKKDIQNKQLVILHIPKTAGTSLRKIVEMNYAPHECYFIYDKDTPFNTMEDFRKLSVYQKKQYKLIMGHFPLSPNVEEGLEPVFVAFMRDPVDRVISYYHHVMEQNRKNGVTNGSISLLKYLSESGDSQLENFQTRFLSGMQGTPITERHLEAAYKNIEEKFIFVGLANRFEQSIETLSNMFSWSKNKIPYANRSPNRYPVSYYSEYELEKIKDLNKFDITLFEYVKERIKFK